MYPNEQPPTQHPPLLNITSTPIFPSRLTALCLARLSFIVLPLPSSARILSPSRLCKAPSLRPSLPNAPSLRGHKQSFDPCLHSTTQSTDNSVGVCASTTRTVAPHPSPIYSLHAQTIPMQYIHRWSSRIHQHHHRPLPPLPPSSQSNHPPTLMRRRRSNFHGCSSPRMADAW